MPDTIVIDQVFNRQIALFNPGEHQNRVTILGAGATGSFTALALAKLGFTDIHIWDGDTVEWHNVPNQLHRVSDTGTSKVIATAEIVKSFCDGLGDISPTITTHDQMFEEGDKITHGIVVCAADTMSARELFWSKIKNNLKVDLYLDPRVGGQTFHLYSIIPHNPEHITIYESSLHSDEEGSEVPCGERATCDMSFLVASRIVRAIRRFAVSQIVEPFNIENAVTMELMSVVQPEGV